MLTVACVYNSQTNTNCVTYNISWVEKLYNSLIRNIDIPFNFVCLSNVETPYPTVPLITRSQGFWAKIELFRTNLFKGPVLYFDLDVVICKNITKVISQLPSDKFLMVQEPFRDIINSSIMYWDNQNLDYIYNDFVNDKKQIIDKYSKHRLIWEQDNTTSSLRYDDTAVNNWGDQAYIRDSVTDLDIFENYAPKNFIQWRHHQIKTLLDDPSILIFTSSQKPNNNLDLTVVRNNWC